MGHLSNWFVAAVLTVIAQKRRDYSIGRTDRLFCIRLRKGLAISATVAASSSSSSPKQVPDFIALGEILPTNRLALPA
jgi:hypothetical protein